MKNNFLKLTSFLFATIALASCVKDKGYDNNEYQLLRGNTSAQKVVAIALKTDVNTQESEVSISANASSTVINLVPIVLAGGQVATSDVHVVIDTMNSLVDQTSFTIPANSMFSIVSKTVTIPAGQNTGYIQVKLIPNDFIGQPYALGFKIVSVDNGYTIAGNGRGIGVAEFTIANAYEADYAVNGIRYNYSASPITYNAGDPVPPGYVSTTAIPNPKHMSTIDATHNALDFANLGGSNYQYILDFSTVGTANQDYNIGVILNPPALAGNSLISYVVHKYNPVTKTLTLVVLYNNNGTGTGNWRLLFETLTRI